MAVGIVLVLAATSAAAARDVLHEGQQEWLTLAWFGLVSGLAAKLLDRSFWRWFAVGALARIVLVALNVGSI